MRLMVAASMGTVVGYEPDRAHARACAGDLADILSGCLDCAWLLFTSDLVIR